jgi:serine/threonine protein kinase
MGTVWRASDELLRREVAVKEVLLPPGIPAAERGVLCERTLREARAAAALNHPAVIRVYDVVNDGDRPWIVMELLDAKSVADLLRDEGPLPYDRVAEVGLSVLGALETAHRVGVLHRDVKPGNVLLGNDGRVTLTDFGVARSPNESPLTSTGLLLGSPQYIAPERARGKPFGPSSDLFSLGATLYTAVEGRPPFDRGDPLPTMTAVVMEPPDQMAAAGPLTPVLLGLLEKDPTERWDVDRTRDALRTVLAGGRITALGGGRTPKQSGGDTGRLAGLRRRRDQDPPRETAPVPSVPSPTPTPQPMNGWAGAPPMPPAGSGAPPPPPGMQQYPPNPPMPPGHSTGEMPSGPFSTEGMPSLPPPDEDDDPPNGRAGPSGTARVPLEGAAAYRPSGSASVPPASHNPYEPPYDAGYQSGMPRRNAYLDGPEQNSQPQPQPQMAGGWGMPPAAPTAPIGRASAIGGHTITAPAHSTRGQGWSRLDARTRAIVLVVVALGLVVLIGVASYLISAATSSGTDQAGAPPAPSGQPQQAAAVELTAYNYPDRGFSLSAPLRWNSRQSRAYVEFNSPDNSEKIRIVVENASSAESAVNAAEGYQRGLERDGTITGFKTLRKEQSTKKLADNETYEWEWVYNDKGKPRHRLWRVTVVDGKSYSLYLSTPESSFNARKPLYNQVTGSFRLTG